jgi:hypothetical protein
MRQVLAEQQPNEDIDGVIQRVTQRVYPECQDALFQLISKELEMSQGLLAITRQEAATKLAKSESKLQMHPEGIPEMRTIFESEIQFSENISPEQREQIKKQLEEARAAGKPIPTIQLSPTKRTVGCTSLFVALALLALVGWSLCGG